MLTACATRQAGHVEVTPKLCWHVRDYPAADGSDITNYWVTNCYAPFVISQGVPFTIDFAQHETFASPDTGKTEHYFDGVVARLTVAVSNTTACFSGRADYDLHLGVTSSYYDDDESLYAQTLRSYSTRFSGSCTLGHEMRVGAGEDINDEPVVFFTFRQIAAPSSKFSSKILDESH